MSLLLAAILAAMPLAADDLGHGIVVVRGAFVPGRQPDGNSVLLRGPDGWIVVDSGRHAGHTRKVLDRIAASGAPLVAIVNTHWHLDHVSGNPMLRAAFPRAEVLASDAIDVALGGFLADYRRQLEAMLAKPPSDDEAAAWRAEIARIDQGKNLKPTRIVGAAGEFELAGRPVRLGLADHAATAGDVWLYDPASKVLVAGDLVTLPAPFLDTACAPRWQQALAALEDTGFETLVPGHGAPMSRAQFATYRQAYDGLLECAASEAEPAACVGRWQRDAGDLLHGQDEGLTRNLVEYYVAQRLRGDGARKDCPAGV